MIKIKIKDLEKQLGKRIRQNTKVVGLDTASRTGWCEITTSKTEAIINWGFIKIDSKDQYVKYNQLIEIFQKLIKEWNCPIVIEDVFFGRNVNTLKVLARLGMIAYVLAKLGNLPTNFILASTARAKLGFNGIAKKAFVHNQIQTKLKISLEDEDIVDAFVLSLTGIVIPEGLEV